MTGTAQRQIVGLRTGRRLRRLAGAVAALTVVLAGGVSPGPTAHAAEPDACAPTAVGCFPRMAWGVGIEGLPASTTAMDAFEAAVGRQADVALSFTSFRYGVDGAGLRALVAAGQLPMVTWEPFDATVPTEDRYPLREIAAGAHDAYLRAQAARIRDAGGPVAVRFGHEMNGDWYPWGAGVGGNSPADYVAAYRHVHDVFTDVGADQVVWVWSPGALDSSTAPDLAPFYPGDAYVDWAALSVYYDQETDTWANTVSPTLRQLDLVAPGKPIYLAETSVLPGPDRAAMIEELLGSLLRTPRAVGFTWFEFPSRHDWRIGADSAAQAAVRAALSSGWYTSSPTTPAPLLQVPPAVEGVPRVGTTLTATPGAWRGATSTTGRWVVCADATPASCVPASGTGASMTLTEDVLGRTVRHVVTATGPGGTTTAMSAPTTPTVMLPATPGRPALESRTGGAHLRFPTPPAGTTHWRLVVDGRALQAVPVGTADYWLTGLADGTTHTLALSALAITGSTVLASSATSGTFVPMPQQFAPYVAVTGTSAEVTLPKAPVGAETWVLTVGGESRTVPLGTTRTSVTVATGSPVGWTLTAAAGRWDDGTHGATTVPSTGSFTPVAAPAAPTVTPGPGSATLTFPAAPAGATAWRVSVGATTYPDLPVGTAGLTATGLYPGYPATWTLRAVNATARSAVVSGRVEALAAGTTPTVTAPATPARPVVESRTGGARVRFPAAPSGTTHWRLTVDGKALQLVPVGTADYWITGMVDGTSHTLALAAAAVSGSTVKESSATSGTFVPMPQQFAPYVAVTGTSAEVTLPKAPVGAETWVLTVGGESRTVPLGTTRTSVTVATGSPVRWTLTAAAGRWDDSTHGATTVPSTGSFTPLATPAAPTVTPGSGSLTLTFPAAPAGATAWRVSVGARTFADVPVGTPDLTATGLYPGYPSTWTLRAVNATARSLPVTGTAAAR